MTEDIVEGAGATGLGGLGGLATIGAASTSLVVVGALSPVRHTGILTRQQYANSLTGRPIYRRILTWCFYSINIPSGE